MAPQVLCACEFSGTVRNAFRKRGIQAWSCDLIPGEPGSMYHLQQCVLELLEHPWDLVIAHPPCTFLANSGVRWLAGNPQRQLDMEAGARFFKLFLELDQIKRVCIENPIMHKHAKGIIGQDYSQLVQPWMFGHFESKGTCLWLKGLPDLIPTNIVGPPPKVKTADEVRSWNRIHNLPPTHDRQKLRSVTYQGISDAMAKQWGDLLLT